MTEPPTTKVLFVCLGNICRSPLAEGVFQHISSSVPSTTRRWKTDSCGTASYHTGSSPDSRTLETLRSHGMTRYVHSARQFDSSRDFKAFDYIFAMDRSNLANLQRLREHFVKQNGEESVGEVMLFGEFAGSGSGAAKEKAEEVEDPYYGGQDLWDAAYEQVNRFSRNFLKKLEEADAGRL